MCLQKKNNKNSCGFVGQGEGCKEKTLHEEEWEVSWFIDNLAFKSENCYQISKCSVRSIFNKINFIQK